MTITHIELIRVSSAFETGGPRNGLRPGMPPWREMESLMVRVGTKDGCTGWGEAFGHFVNPGTFAVLESQVGPWFLGRDSRDIAGLMEQAHRTLFGFGRSGPVAYALSAIDTALWDIAAQRAGMPLFRLLGGARTQLTRYASMPRYGDPDAVRRKVEEAIERGYTLIKLHETATACFQAAADAAAGRARIALDVNCAWTPLEARAVARSLDPAAFAWLEEPVWPPEDFQSLAALRGGVAISAGENLGALLEFKHAFDARAVDIVQPSVAKSGGISALRAVSVLADAHGVQCLPHCYYYGPGYLATAHFLAAKAVEMPLETAYLDLQDAPHPAFDPTHASLTLEDVPGLGFDPQADYLHRRTIARSELSQH